MNTSSQSPVDTIVEAVASQAADAAREMAVPAAKFAGKRLLKTQGLNIAMILAVLIVVPIAIKKLKGSSDSEGSSK